MTRPHPFRLLGFLVCLSAAAPATAVVQLPAGFVNEVIVPDLTEPTSMAFLPDGRLLLTEQRTGRVRMVVNGHIAAQDPVLVLPDLNATGYERGFQGIAVDPRWPASPYVYLLYTRTGSRERLVRYRGFGDIADPLGGNLTLAEPRVLIDDIPDTGPNHNGGCLRIDDELMLFVGLGDDEDLCGAADSTKLKGQILRLRVEGLPDGPGAATRAAITPADNPLSTPDSNARLVWAYGLRNPWRFHVDTPTGMLYVTDVGDASYEELDEVSAGDFLGWPWREADAVRTRSQCPEPGGPGAIAHRRPILALERGQELTAVGSAGLYRVKSGVPANWPPEYDGDVFYAEYYSGWLRRLRKSGGVWMPADPVKGQPSTLDWGRGLVSAVDFLQGPDGSLWWLRQYDDSFQGPTGSLQRIRYIGEVVSAQARTRPPATLAAAPSPFTARTELRFAMAAAGYVRLEVFDVSGRLVRRLLDGTVAAGEQRFEWDGLDHSGRTATPGIYLARLERPGGVEAVRLLRVR